MQKDEWIGWKYKAKTLNSFLEFEELFINQYTPLDDKNTTQNRLH